MACQTCIHPERDAIERAILAGEPQRVVAERYKLAKTTLNRHLAVHTRKLGPVATRTTGPKPFAPAEDLAGWRDRAEALGRIAETKGNIRDALLAIREQRSCLEAYARILEQSHSSGQAALQHPLVRDLLVVMARLVQPHPDLSLALCTFLQDRLHRSPFGAPTPQLQPPLASSVSRDTLSSDGFRDKIASDVSPEFANIIVQGHS